MVRPQRESQSKGTIAPSPRLARGEWKAHAGADPGSGSVKVSSASHAGLSPLRELQLASSSSRSWACDRSCVLSQRETQLLCISAANQYVLNLLQIPDVRAPRSGTGQRRTGGRGQRGECQTMAAWAVTASRGLCLAGRLNWVNLITDPSCWE